MHVTTLEELLGIDGGAAEEHRTFQEADKLAAAHLCRQGQGRLAVEELLTAAIVASFACVKEGRSVEYSMQLIDRCMLSAKVIFINNTHGMLHADPVELPNGTKLAGFELTRAAAIQRANGLPSGAIPHDELLAYAKSLDGQIEAASAAVAAEVAAQRATQEAEHKGESSPHN